MRITTTSNHVLNDYITLDLTGTHVSCRVLICKLKLREFQIHSTKKAANLKLVHILTIQPRSRLLRYLLECRLAANPGTLVSLI